MAAAIQFTISGKALLESYLLSQEMRLERNDEGLVRAVPFPRPADVPLEHSVSRWMPEELMLEIFKESLVEFINKALQMGLTVASGNPLVGLASAVQYTQYAQDLHPNRIYLN